MCPELDGLIIRIRSGMPEIVVGLSLAEPSLFNFKQRQLSWACISVCRLFRTTWASLGGLGPSLLHAYWPWPGSRRPGHLTSSSYYRTRRVGRRPGQRRRRGWCTSNSDGPGPGWRKPLEFGPDRCLRPYYLLGVVVWAFPLCIFSWAVGCGLWPVGVRTGWPLAGLFSCENRNRNGLRGLMQFGPLCGAFDQLQFRFLHNFQVKPCQTAPREITHESETPEN
jgi:hypothetical protein